MARSGHYQFIGPLKPGQKPPTIIPGDRDDNWTILDLLKNNPASKNTNSTNKKPRKFVRAAGGTVWEDPTLAEWDHDDYRVFVGDLGNDVTDDLLTTTFGQYPSFLRAKVVRDQRTKKSKGYGFVSFKEPHDYARAIKEWDGKYLGSRPIKLRKSNWRDRSIDARKAETDTMSGTTATPIVKPRN